MPVPGPGFNITAKYNSWSEGRVAKIYGDDLSQAEQTYTVTLIAKDDHLVHWPGWTYNVIVKDPCMDSSVAFWADKIDRRA